MACDKPNGDCTNVSPCGSGCGCSGGSGTPETPIVPRCQNVVLVPGTYTNATIVVNGEGCISLVSAGEPPVYTPDECCGGTSTGSGTTTTVRGEKGDAGTAATIAVEQNVAYSGTSWSVQNVGTPNAAVFRFTAPVPVTPTVTTSGATGSVAGLQVQDGLVQALPPALVNAVQVEKAGAYAPSFTFLIAPAAPATPNTYKITLDLDGLAAAVLAGTGIGALSSRVSALESAVSGMPSSVYEIAAATGVNLIDSTGVVVPTAKVLGLSANVWKIGVAYAGSNVAGSNGTVAQVDALGRVTLPALEYPADLG